MKKAFTKILIFILTLITCFSLTACHDFGAEGGGAGSGSGSGEGQASEIVAPTNLANSKTLAQGITLKENTAPFTNLIDATLRVQRSCVMIGVKVNNTTYSGSGVIVDVDDGENNPNEIYVITCHHMVKEGGSIMVAIPDENMAYNNAKYVFNGVIGGSKANNANNAVVLVGGDEVSDIAVLKIDISGSTITASDIVKAQVVSESAGLGVGVMDEVFAIGNPSGSLPGTVTTGHIAYDGLREIYINGIGNMSLYQIDLTTHHGSSGGGLFTNNGSLLGITNSGDDEFTGLNFAIPFATPETNGIDNGFISIAKQLIATAKANNYNNYGYISGRKERLGIVVEQGENKGVNVIVVEEGSLGARKGLKTGDVIKYLTIYEGSDRNKGNDYEIADLSAFSTRMQQAKIGDTIVITVDRLGQQGYLQNVSVEIAINQYYFANTGIYTA